MRFHILFIFGTVFWACPGGTDDPDFVPITNRQFNYHQDVNQLYYGMEVEDKYNMESLMAVQIHWYATSRGNTPDTLILYDDGTKGDILSGDGLYGLKIDNDSTIIQNIMGEDSGNVYLDFMATYVTETVTVSDSFSIGNIIPRIIRVSAPDTIVRPPEQTVSLHLITTEVFDADGLGTIKWVGFTSYHVEGDSMVNNGNYIHLFDSEFDNYGYPTYDSINGDGIFSRYIPVYGPGFPEPQYQTKTGNFIWRFLTQDLENEYSKVREHEILIQ